MSIFIRRGNVRKNLLPTIQICLDLSFLYLNHPVKWPDLYPPNLFIWSNLYLPDLFIRPDLVSLLMKEAGSWPLSSILVPELFLLHCFMTGSPPLSSEFTWTWFKMRLFGWSQSYIPFMQLPPAKWDLICSILGNNLSFQANLLNEQHSSLIAIIIWNS